ncbi:unnamed protein product [Spirodela intermedia]|uniref:Kinesin-like protein KIN-10A n=1 Tax=Spirodela intermedia TaxID=51605 RepID=A0A7I8KN44_SPIIN|nr:unnamed protein product [Spirodela intermedia]
MAPTPSSRYVKEHVTPSKTPQSKHRLHFPGAKNLHAAAPSPLPAAARENAVPTEHPVEVIGRIRDYPDRKEKPPSILEIPEDGRSVRVRTDIGYRDFSLDGVSISAEENLEGFYQRFVESRIRGVRLGSKCTIMMYGPTGAGKSHTMFGSVKEQGIVYRALRDILGEGEEEENSGVDDEGFGAGLFVQVAVLEIYNEEIYDLLSGNAHGGALGGLPKGSTPKARLEIIGKKAKNATYISGNEAGKLSKEVAKVEKRRIVRSTLCNERSSRSHCLIILDVPSVGGRLMLVDMAGSENIEQAGQIGLEAKLQTAKINQGNVALKRVVESIANGDSHVPFRDSKLTMLLQDSFEDDKSKILMILCASPDPTEIHKTISTLEYGAKAKCIVRAAHLPTPSKHGSEESGATLASRIAAMNQFILKLQTENKMRERERDEAHRELMKREEEANELRSRLERVEGRGSSRREEEIRSKVDERTQILRQELERMEKKILQQEEELEILRRRLDNVSSQSPGAGFLKRFSDAVAENDRAMMEKSMDLDIGDDQIFSAIPEKKTAALSTVLEAEEEEEVEKGVVVVEEEEEHGGGAQRRAPDPSFHLEDTERGGGGSGFLESSSARRTRIQNIFRLCGNYREIAQQVQGKIPIPFKRKSSSQDPFRASPAPTDEEITENTPRTKPPAPAPSPPSLRRENGVLSDITETHSVKRYKSAEKENRRLPGEDEGEDEGPQKIRAKTTTHLQKSQNPFCPLENNLSVMAVIPHE